MIIARELSGNSDKLRKPQTWSGGVTFARFTDYQRAFRWV